MPIALENLRKIQPDSLVTREGRRGQVGARSDHGAECQINIRKDKGNGGGHHATGLIELIPFEPQALSLNSTDIKR